jgi:biotin synthase
MRLSVPEIEALFELPFNDLLFRAQGVHRRHFDPNAVQLSTLLSIKTGGCPEDCGYCSQSVHHKTAIDAHALMTLDAVIETARQAKAHGASRFCMAAAWRGPKDRDLIKVAEMVQAVKDLGLETCVTLGMLRDGQAEQLADAGLDYYNHNLDTSREYYEQIIHTHTYDDRLDTLNKVRQAGIKVCCGGIIGMGESRQDRAAFIAELTMLDPMPESVPINLLARVAGTALAGAPVVKPIEFVRTIAATRIALPTAMVRLSAGRNQMPDYLQALCFFAGANSIFYGDRLLTTENPDADKDHALFEQLGLRPMPAEAPAERAVVG